MTKSPSWMARVILAVCPDIEHARSYPGYVQIRHGFATSNFPKRGLASCLRELGRNRRWVRRRNRIYLALAFLGVPIERRMKIANNVARSVLGDCPPYPESRAEFRGAGDF